MTPGRFAFAWRHLREDGADATLGRDIGRERAMSGLYEEDVVLWSECQVELLRRHAAGERVNDGALDWSNIIEEIESVGNEQRHAVESLLLRALIHWLKAEAWPESRDVPHWRAEERTFLYQAGKRFAPSMRQRLDLADIYAAALRGLPESSDGQPPLPVPEACPFTLEALLARA